MEHKKYEYQIIEMSMSIETYEQLEKILNEAGSDGWELIIKENAWCFFKRAIINQPS